MPDVKSVLSEEIRRLARKEVKAAVAPLQETVSTLKKVVAEQRRQLAALQKLVAPQQEAAEAEAAEAPAEEAPAETRPAYNRDQAEAIFRRDILPTLVAKAKHVCLPVSLAQTSPSLPLRLLLKYTLRDEQRYPRSLFFALRGAFRHRKFTLFRGNDARGPEFVANMVPAPFTAEHAVREIKAALDYVTAHPLCTRAELLAALKTELADMDIAVVARQIAFLFQKGHIIEYYNGVLALPEDNPKFRKLPEEMKRERAADEAGAKPAEEAPAPAPEDETPAGQSVEPPAPEAAPAEPVAEVPPEPAPEAAPAESEPPAPVQEPVPEGASDEAQ